MRPISRVKAASPCKNGRFVNPKSRPSPVVTMVGFCRCRREQHVRKVGNCQGAECCIWASILPLLARAESRDLLPKLGHLIAIGLRTNPQFSRHTFLSTSPPFVQTLIKRPCLQSASQFLSERPCIWESAHSWGIWTVSRLHIAYGQSWSRL